MPNPFETNAQGQVWDSRMRTWSNEDVNFLKQREAQFVANPGNPATWTRMNGWAGGAAPIPDFNAMSYDSRTGSWSGAKAPQSIVGLSGVTRNINAQGQILGDNGQAMTDGAGNQLMYRADGVYSPSGQKLYNIQNGRVMPLSGGMLSGAGAELPQGTPTPDLPRPPVDQVANWQERLAAAQARAREWTGQMGLPDNPNNVTVQGGSTEGLRNPIWGNGGWIEGPGRGNRMPSSYYGAQPQFNNYQAPRQGYNPRGMLQQLLMQLFRPR